MDSKSGTILYISYDGLLEPLGESQVLQYLEVLAKDHRIFLLTYEKPADWSNVARRGAFVKRVAKCGIKWIPRIYHKNPTGLSTAYDISLGIVLALYLGARHRVEIVHARSYVPAVIALCLKRMLGVSFIFDMRGFWADERVNAGQWGHASRMYRVAKWFEKRFLLAADVVVSLTETAVNEISKFPYLSGRLPEFHVIRTCTNMSIFRPRSNLRRSKKDGDQIPRPFVLGCVGSVGGWFRFDAVLGLFTKLLVARPDARLAVLNRGEHEYIENMVEKTGLPKDRIRVVAVNYNAVPKEIALMSAGVFFYQPSYSELARSPTKMGEFLSCGVPCVTNSGIGDSEEILSENGVGVVIDDFINDQFDWAATQILKLTNKKSIHMDCVQTAEKYFSLATGVKSYSDSYRRILAQRSAIL